MGAAFGHSNGWGSNAWPEKRDPADSIGAKLTRRRYPSAMGLFLDSFWRAVAYCIHPRVIALSLLPLVLMVALALGAGYFYWDAAMDSVRVLLESSPAMSRVGAWLEALGLLHLNAMVAPLIVVFAVTPIIVVVSLLVIAWMMTPSLVSLVAEKRFAKLERKRGGSWWLGLLWSMGSLLIALAALIVSMPLWLVPPLVLLLPPLIWGWLTYRVMAFDALAEHASAPERRELFRRYRPWLLGIGVITGYLGSAPSLVWASGAVMAAAFVILVPLAIWIYTLVFAFSSLWFTHFSLAALADLRREQASAEAGPFDSAPASASTNHPEPTHESDTQTALRVR